MVRVLVKFMFWLGVVALLALACLNIAAWRGWL